MMIPTSGFSFDMMQIVSKLLFATKTRSHEERSSFSCVFVVFVSSWLFSGADADMAPFARYDDDMKSTVDEIRARFDTDVERFSNLQTGQSATMDAPLALELIAEAAKATTPKAARLLDIGCGAGNYTLKLLEVLPRLDVTLIDLSRPMLDRAEQRIRAAGAASIRAIQQDVRDADLGENTVDVIVAAAVLHHLRADDEWRAVFAKLYRALSPHGSLWIFDMVEPDMPWLHDHVWQRWGAYLESFRGPSYRDEVFAYVDREDTPRPLVYQLDLLRAVGFTTVGVLHKHACFAAFGAVKDETATSR
jgi:tRNA (cmo5U34)-methyltransferase